MMLLEDKLKCFSVDHPLVLSVVDIATWQLKENGCRLYLPPIQRSVLWSNAQVINFWDSLFRGYPLGMMMIHRACRMNENGIPSGVDVEGHTREISETDYELFDGQQRMASILL